MENHTEFGWSSTLSLKVLQICLMPLNKPATAEAVCSALTNLTLLPGPLSIYTFTIYLLRIKVYILLLHVSEFYVVPKYITFQHHSSLSSDLRNGRFVCELPRHLDLKVFFFFLVKAPPYLLALTLMATTFIRFTEHRFWGLFLGIHEIWEMGSEA